LFRVVIREALGAPLAPFPVPTAPIAPEPLMPEESAPVKLTTVIELATLCESVATTFAFDRRANANARQISAVPRCTFVR